MLDASATTQPGHGFLIQPMADGPKSVVHLFEAIKVKHKNSKLFTAARQAPSRPSLKATRFGSCVSESCRTTFSAFQKGDEPLCKFKRMGENAAQQNACVDDNQNRYQQIDEIAAAADANRSPQDDGRHHSNRRHGNGRKSKRATGQHSSTEARHQQLPAVRRAGKETYGKDRPHAAQNERIPHQPMNRLTGYGRAWQRAKSLALLGQTKIEPRTIADAHSAANVPSGEFQSATARTAALQALANIMPGEWRNTRVI